MREGLGGLIQTASGSDLGFGSPETKRSKLLEFLAKQPVCRVAMEVCASAHHWGRQIQELGHEVRLISPVYVKPYVKRQKNDANDAGAIVEAAQRPTMRFVAVKTEEEQARSVVFRARELLVRQRTQTIKCAAGSPRGVRTRRSARDPQRREAGRGVRGV